MEKIKTRIMLSQLFFVSGHEVTHILGCERTGSDNACVRVRVSRQTILSQN